MVVAAHEGGRQTVPMGRVEGVCEGTWVSVCLEERDTQLSLPTD